MKENPARTGKAANRDSINTKALGREGLPPSRAGGDEKAARGSVRAAFSCLFWLRLKGLLPDYAGAPASREMEDAVARSEGRVSSMKS
ncbi:hypothetical protein Bwad004_35030 [Bilophila wadsworthia]